MAIKSNNNLRELLENRVREQGEKIFLFSEADGRRWTYPEFDKAVNRAANMFAQTQYRERRCRQPADAERAEYIIAYFACWKIGALAGPVNSLLKAEEIAFVINNSEAKMLLVQFAISSR